MAPKENAIGATGKRIKLKFWIAEKTTKNPDEFVKIVKVRFYENTRKDRGSCDCLLTTYNQVI